MRRLAILGGLIAALLLPGAASAATLVPIVEGHPWATEPIFATAPPADKRIFVVERGDFGTPGAIRVVENGTVKAQPFLSIGNIDLSAERGLLSMAFAPDYATSGRFYVFYTAGGGDALDPSGEPGDIRIVEYRRSASDPNLADPASARLVLVTRHSATNHNGGWIAFGPDGKLYITIGDNAVDSNSQSLTNLFGKVLRIDPADPDGAGPLTATIPDDNPFANTSGARGEIYTFGLRNPFRASFAPNGDLTIGDVGGGINEEINAGDLAGKNMGWPECEGFCDTPNPFFTDPVFEYPNVNSTDCAVLGGHVVRDPDLTGLTGRYLYADFCADDLRTLNLSVPGADPGFPGIELSGSQGWLRSFAEDSRGCSYVVTTESVFRIAAGPNAGAECPRVVSPPPPPPPPPLPDVTFDFQIPKKRPLARRITVSGTCSIGCDLKAAGTVVIGRNRFLKRTRRIKLAEVTVDAAAKTRTNLALVLPNGALKKARKAARRGSRITAHLKITAAADDGSGGSGSGRVRLIPAGRR
ncbi:MAG TPA: PQQ-dependent sugar dehydrogenase [Solirubrobacterales bacterium]|nr:PQQ-dependent sugar dehydrogenase [Solirubrobacterales bacterium]